jgi:hypothetical protein
MSKPKYSLSYKTVVKALEKRDPDAPCSQWYWTCPLAAILRAEQGAPSTTVTPEYWAVYDDLGYPIVKTKTPKWAAKAIGEIDEKGWTEWTNAEVLALVKKHKEGRS